MNEETKKMLSDISDKAEMKETEKRTLDDEFRKGLKAGFIIGLAFSFFNLLLGGFD